MPTPRIESDPGIGRLLYSNASAKRRYSAALGGTLRTRIACVPESEKAYGQRHLLMSKGGNAPARGRERSAHQLWVTVNEPSFSAAITAWAA
jgi:hypothetical protein